MNHLLLSLTQRSDKEYNILVMEKSSAEPERIIVWSPIREVGDDFNTHQISGPSSMQLCSSLYTYIALCSKLQGIVKQSIFTIMCDVCLLFCCCCQVNISSMKFVMGQGQLLKQVFKLLDMAQVRNNCRIPFDTELWYANVIDSCADSF